MKEQSLFCERLITAIRISRKSVNRIERELGYPRNALHNYINGGEPSGRRLIELSNYFHLTPEYLLGVSNRTHQVSLNQLFEELDDSQKLTVFELSQYWASQKLMFKSKP